MQSGSLRLASELLGAEERHGLYFDMIVSEHRRITRAITPLRVRERKIIETQIIIFLQENILRMGVRK